MKVGFRSLSVRTVERIQKKKKIEAPSVRPSVRQCPRLRTDWWFIQVIAPWDGIGPLGGWWDCNGSQLV